MSYENIPNELQQYQQWINWEYRNVEHVEQDGSKSVRQTKVPVRPIDGRNASSTNPLDWTSFERAVAAARQFNRGLGFVFTKSDPYCGFDLDDPEGNEAVAKRHGEIYAQLNSYSEWSPSGKGIHVIVKASLPAKGRHPKYYGCFDNERFFTFTGVIAHAAPIADRQSETEAIYQTLSTDVIKVTNAGYMAEIYSDEEVIQKASTASNSAKFLRLWSGDWQTDYGPNSNAKDKSKSSADFALIDIIGFYSRNHVQTCRLFRQSVLGNTGKVKAKDYVEKTAARAFDRMPPVITITPGMDGPWFSATQFDPWVPKVEAIPVEVDFSVFDRAEPATGYHVPSPAAYTYDPYDEGRPLDFPAPKPPPAIPGLLGELVAAAWNASPHQIAEVALASGLSTMSLLASRVYRFGTLPLNLYLMVLAQTSTGKSFGFTANDKWISEIRKVFSNPADGGKESPRYKFIDNMIMKIPGSAQGLAHHMQVLSPAVLMHADEWVNSLRQMSMPASSPHDKALRDELLTLVENAGPGRIYRAAAYSMRGQNNGPPIKDVLSASLTMLVTGTPEAFYDDLNASMLTSGLIPRFTILDYEGGLTRPNPEPATTIQPHVLNQIGQMLSNAYNKSLVINGEISQFTDCVPTQEARARIEWFTNVCYRQIEEANHSGTNMAGMWSRAKEHVNQIACLIAIGVNPLIPVIQAEYVNLAISIVRPAIEKIKRKVVIGETGQGDDRLEAEFKRTLYRMIDGGWPVVSKYPGCKRELVDNGYYQLQIVRNRCMALAVFKNHKLGSNRAFEDTLKAMVAYGFVSVQDVNSIKCIVPNMQHFRAH